MSSKIYYRVVYSPAEYSGLYDTKEIEFPNRQRLLELWESLAAICAFCFESGVRICTAIPIANSDISEDAFEQALTKNRERVDLRKLGYMNEPVQYVQTEAFLKLYIVSMCKENTLRVCSSSRSVADVCIVIRAYRLVALDEKLLISCKEVISHPDDFIYMHFVLLHIRHLIEKYDLFYKRTFRQYRPYLRKLEL